MCCSITSFDLHTLGKFKHGKTVVQKQQNLLSLVNQIAGW